MKISNHKQEPKPKVLSQVLPTSQLKTKKQIITHSR